MVLVLCKSTVSACKRSINGEQSPSDHKPNMKHFKQPAIDNRHEPLSNSRPSDKALKPRFHRGSVPLACAAPDILALQKRICSILGLLLPFIWFVWSHGLMGMNWLLHASLLFRDSLIPMPLNGFTNSVLIGREPSITITLAIKLTKSSAIEKNQNTLQRSINN